MSDADITAVGNVTRDPELRFTPGGQAKATFGIAVNRKWANKATGEQQEQTSFLNVVAWGELGENVASSLTKGMRVIVKGRLEQRSWDKDDGSKGSVVEVVADEVGPSLRWRTVTVDRAERSERTSAPKAASDGFSEEPF